MKRLSVLVAVMAIVGLISSAAMAEGMTFGVKGGLNLADVTGDDAEGWDMKIAFGGGIYMNYAFTEALSVQPELFFMLKGAKAEAGDEEVKFNMTYIDIPVLVKYTIPMEGAFAPCVFAGPYLGMLMSAKMEDVDIKDDMKTMDYGVVLGAGFDYKMNEGCITFDARYALGLAKIIDVEDVDVKNTGIMFMVGYGFAF